MTSGEIKTIVVNDNIQYNKAKVGADGMFLRIGAGGATELYRAVDQDVVMIDDVTVSTPIPSAWTQMFSITLTTDVTPENGSMVFSGDFFNDSSQDRELWMRMMVDGVQVRSDFIFDLWKDTANDHQQVIMSTTPENTFLSGQVVTLELGADSDGNITMNGDYQQGRLKITEAQAAPVAGTYMNTSSIETFDWNLLPHGDPGISGQLYIAPNNTIRVSQG